MPGNIIGVKQSCPFCSRFVRL